MFKGCKREDMPPHIYATAQTCYRTMFSANINQSIVLQGCAGSGKTYNLHQLIKYFTTVTKSAESKATGCCFIYDSLLVIKLCTVIHLLSTTVCLNVLPCILFLLPVLTFYAFLIQVHPIPNTKYIIARKNVFQ